MMEITYSVEDDKLRLYCDKVDDATFKRLRDLRFLRAPAQGCFYATWSPEAEDLVLELAGPDSEIEDESITPEQRAAARAERYERYSASASKEAERRLNAANKMAELIPLGQPILVGHYSEGKHRRDLARIHANYDKGFAAQNRAADYAGKARSTAAHADRRTDPRTVKNRIKEIESNRRRQERHITTVALQKRMGYYYEGSVYGTEDHAAASIARCQRYIEHYDLRLAYERQLLADLQGE